MHGSLGDGDPLAVGAHVQQIERGLEREQGFRTIAGGDLIAQIRDGRRPAFDDMGDRQFDGSAIVDADPIVSQQIRRSQQLDDRRVRRDAPGEGYTGARARQNDDAVGGVPAERFDAPMLRCRGAVNDSQVVLQDIIITDMLQLLCRGLLRSNLLV